MFFSSRNSNSSPSVAPTAGALYISSLNTRLVRNALVGTGLKHRVRVGASGKIHSAAGMADAFGLGADWCNSARGFMFALGCIQAQTCHTGHCPTGVTTQDAKRQIALVVPDKAQRVRNFHRNTLESLKELLEAAGLHSPQELSLRHVMRRVSNAETRPLSVLYPAVSTGSLRQAHSADALKDMPLIFQDHWLQATAESFQPPVAH